MVAVMTLCVVTLGVLLMPEVFVELGRGIVENPGVGVLIVALLGLIGGWIYKR